MFIKLNYRNRVTTYVIDQTQLGNGNSCLFILKIYHF